MALPHEKLLKDIVHDRFSEMNISDHIKDALSESVDIGPGSVRQIHDNDLLPILKEKGVLDDVMSQLQFDNYYRVADTIPGAPQPNSLY